MNTDKRFLEQVSYELFIVEFGPHVQVIVPWLLSSYEITSSLHKVFVPSQAVHPLRDHLRTNEMIADVFTIDDLVSEIKKFKAQRRGVGIKVIVTSSPESRVSMKYVLAILYLACISCEVICIRSPREWFYSTRNKTSVPRLSTHILTSLRVFCLDLVCFLAERLLLMRSKKVVFEHEAMMQFFYSKSRHLVTRKPWLVFPGRLPKLNNKLVKIGVRACKDTKTLGIGILGTLNRYRRDYDPLLEAMGLLRKQGYRPRVYFLGGHVGIDSEQIIELFNEFLEFAPTKENPYVADSQVLLMESDINVLIAPFSKDWGYLHGKSTGSIADAIYLGKPLLMPRFVKHIFDYDWVSYYSTAEDLKHFISRCQSLPIPTVDFLDADLTQFLRK